MKTSQSEKHPDAAIRIFTIGHSTRSFEEFLELLEEFRIQVLVDIRRYPSSRKFPHFNSELMRESLADHRIEYVWLEELGGRRHGANGFASPNTGLRSLGFRNYADHMLTDEFHHAIQRVLSLASDLRVALMCAEKLYFKCHRFLLSDYLFARGTEVEHIVGPGQLRKHKLSNGAVIREDGAVIYPPTSA